MHAAILTAFLFAFSAIFSQRAGRIFGSLAANFYRLCGACTLLGIITWSAFPQSVRPELFWWFFLSGAIGFGLGDVALFLSYARLGSRLTLLIHFCVSVVSGALGDWFWLGKAMGRWETAAVALILAGLLVTLLAQRAAPREGFRASGIFWALVSALGMGLGTVISHVAIEKAAALGTEVPGISQAWQRSTAGVLVAGLVLALLPLARRLAGHLAQVKIEVVPPDKKAQRGKGTPSGCTAAIWLGGTILLGPTLGVSCYQWAIMLTHSSAIVLAVAATSTLIIIPLARVIEKDRAGNRQIAGTLLAVAGVVWLCLLRK